MSVAHGTREASYAGIPDRVLPVRPAAHVQGSALFGGLGSSIRSAWAVGMPFHSSLCK